MNHCSAAGTSCEGEMYGGVGAEKRGYSVRQGAVSVRKSGLASGGGSV